jgi:hypothetical protein
VRPVLLVLLLVLAGCAVGGAPRDDGAVTPTPERVERALRFAALAPLPGGAGVVRLETESGIDTWVRLVVRLGETDAWLAASGLRVGEQQRIANPDGAVVHREARRTGPGELAVTAFTT